MKKTLLVTLFLSAFYLSNGQSDTGDFTIAPQLGLNLSNYSSSENLSNKTRTSINLGAIAEYYFNDRWSFRSGLLYDSKGTRLSGRQFGGEFVDKLNYLAIPLHAN